MSVYEKPADRSSHSNSAQKALAILFLCSLLLFIQIFIRGDSSSGFFGSSYQDTESSFGQAVASIDFLDVGQGSASLLRFSDGKVMLVDSGPPSKRDALLSYLKERDVDHLDCLVITHQHGDHAGNISAVLDTCSVDEVVCPAVPEALLIDPARYEKIYKDIKNHGLKMHHPEQGEVLLSGDGYSVTVLSDDTQDYNTLNDYSIVLRVVAGDVSFLMMADAERTTEDQLLKSDFDLDSDILVVGHHGNKYGATQAFLSEVTPDISVISVGVNNFGQPSISVIKRLADAGSTIYRTDVDGTVTFVTDGRQYLVDSGLI